MSKERINYVRTSTQSRLTDTDVLDIRLLSEQGLSYSQIATKVGIDRRTAARIVARQTWDHVPSPVPARGFRNYSVFPDGRVFSETAGKFIATKQRASGEQVVRLRQGSKDRTVAVPTLVAQAFLGTRSQNPRINFVDGQPSNAHVTNIELS